MGTKLRNAKARAQIQRVQKRWDEKLLHVPADIAVIWVALTSAASLSLVALGLLALVAIVAAVIFFV